MSGRERLKEGVRGTKRREKNTLERMGKRLKMEWRDKRMWTKLKLRVKE